MMRNTQKYFLIEPETWQKMKAGITPDLKIKKNYQDFMENKISEENKTKKGWEQYGKNLTPIIAKGIDMSKNLDSPFNTNMKEYLGNSKVGLEKAHSLFNALTIVPGIEIDDQNQLIVDHEPIGNVYQLLFTLISKDAEITENVQELLKKIADKQHVVSRIKNKLAKDFIIQHNILHQNKSVFVPSGAIPPFPRAKIRVRTAASSSPKDAPPVTEAEKRKWVQRLKQWQQEQEQQQTIPKTGVSATAANLPLQQTLGSPLSESTPQKNNPATVSLSAVLKNKRNLGNERPSPVKTRSSAVKKLEEELKELENSGLDNTLTEDLDKTVIEKKKGSGLKKKKRSKIIWASLF